MSNYTIGSLCKRFSAGSGIPAKKFIKKAYIQYMVQMGSEVIQILIILMENVRLLDDKVQNAETYIILKEKPL